MTSSLPGSTVHVLYSRPVDPCTSPVPGNAGIDLRASGVWLQDPGETSTEIHGETYTLLPGKRILVYTGVSIALPVGTWGSIRDRSGLALKQGLHTLGGVIDENYRGEIGVVLVNLGAHSVVLTKNDRIAQLIVVPYVVPRIESVAVLPSTNRGAQGFGSSGK